MLKEFKAFALKGNMVDMAVGIIIGAAFATVIKSLVDDIIMPVTSAIFRIPDFRNLFVLLSNPSGESYVSIEAAREAGAVALGYGLFINALFAFLILRVVSRHPQHEPWKREQTRRRRLRLLQHRRRRRCCWRRYEICSNHEPRRSPAAETPLRLRTTTPHSGARLAGTNPRSAGLLISARSKNGGGTVQCIPWRRIGHANRSDPS